MYITRNLSLRCEVGVVILNYFSLYLAIFLDHPKLRNKGETTSEMQDPLMSTQGISLHEAWLDKETFLISKGVLGQSGDTGVRKFLT